MDGTRCVVEQCCVDSDSGHAAEGSLQLVQSTCNYSLFYVFVLISFLCFLPVFCFPSMVGPVPFCVELSRFHVTAAPIAVCTLFLYWLYDTWQLGPKALSKCLTSDL